VHSTPAEDLKYLFALIGTARTADETRELTPDELAAITHATVAQTAADSREIIAKLGIRARDYPMHQAVDQALDDAGRVRDADAYARLGAVLR
jgi:hypothetical protein